MHLQQKRLGITLETEWEKFRQKIVGLQSDLSRFKVELLDRESFKNFTDNFYGLTCNWKEICITGYFSETIRQELERFVQVKEHKLRLICQELDINKQRDRKNLEVLEKLHKKGVQIKVNNRLHARFLVAHNPIFKGSGLLVLGSFDFNTECMGKERFDAGIKTEHPDLICSALDLFDQIWNEEGSVTLNERYHDSKT